MGNKTLVGIAAGLGAGVLWGFVFLAPQILSGFSSIEITAGRIFFFGLLSLFFAKKAFAIFKRLSNKERFLVFVLSATGFWLYTMCLAYAVQTAGGIITALVIGLLPITISLCANGLKTLTPGFVAGLVLILGGIIMLHFKELLSLFSDTPSMSMLSVLALFSALAMWTWYSIANGTFLKNRPWIAIADYTSLHGLICFTSMAAISIFKIDFPALVSHADFGSFVFWTFLIGIGSTWGAYWLWNICTSHCPPNISGPLVVSETMFGVLFSFAYAQRLPTTQEAIALVLFTAGAYMAVTAGMKKNAT